MDLPEISQKGMTVLTKSNCMNCEKLKAYLFDKNIEFSPIYCDKYYEIEANKKQLREHLITLTGKTINSYPLVFLNGVYLGGYYNVLDYFGDF
jgi:glutaredoxin